MSTIDVAVIVHSLHERIAGLQAENGTLQAKVASLEYLRRKDSGPASCHCGQPTVRREHGRPVCREHATMTDDRVRIEAAADPWALPEGLAWVQWADGTWAVRCGIYPIVSKQRGSGSVYQAVDGAVSAAVLHEALRLCMERNRSGGVVKPCAKATTRNIESGCWGCGAEPGDRCRGEVWEPVKLKDIIPGDTVRMPTSATPTYHSGRVTNCDWHRGDVYLDGVPYYTGHMPESLERKRR